MNTTEIVRILQSNKGTSKFFLGVFPINRLPTYKLKVPSLLIVNTAPSYHPGEHWIAIYVSFKRIEFFDSYGRFIKNTYLLNFFKLQTKYNKVYYNNIQLQSFESFTCGHYCCMYALHKSRKKALKAFIRQFSENFVENDKYILKLFKRSFLK